MTSTGNVGGSTANATLTVNQLASHGHQLYLNGPNPQGVAATNPVQQDANPGAAVNLQNTGSGGGHSHNMSANFTGDATSVLQPYLTTLYIIKT